MIQEVFKRQFSQIKNNRLVFLAIVLTAGFVLYIGHYNGHLLQSLVYLFSIWLCSFFIDLFISWKPVNDDFMVKKPGRETFYLLLCTFLGCLFLAFRFIGDWQNLGGIVKLILMPLILCTFPVVLAVIMLLLKYKPKDLGFKWQGVLTALPVIAIFSLATWLVAPDNIKWEEMITQEGIIAVLFMGFISAALSEEFWRLIAQTRFAAFFRNNGLAWFLATFIWAFMHAPKWYGESNDMAETLYSVIRIIPIGLMWGYLTHKTKSILPSILVHGTNLWGLQNF